MTTETTETTVGGRMLARLRREAGLSQNKLGLLCRVDVSYINHIERNTGPKRSPSREVVLRLRDGLGLDMAQGDRLLYAFGLAPCVDWQGVWDAAAASAPGERVDQNGKMKWRRER